MSNASATRRILSNLNVNTFGTPSPTVRFMGKDTRSLKRGINDVEDPESSAAPSRVCSRLHSTQIKLGAQDSSKINMQGSPSSDPTTIPSGIPDLVPEMSDSNSQHSNRDSIMSLVDSDVEGDTLASQLTTATEMTLPLQSAAALRAENLCLRLRLARFKVETNQTSIPMSQLQIASPRTSVQTSPLPAAPRILLSVSPQTQEKAPHPRLLPAPVLKPTVYSARTITQPHIPSSPPYSANSSPESAVRDEVFRTPALPRSKMYEPTQMSSPPESEDRGDYGEQGGNPVSCGYDAADWRVQYPPVKDLQCVRNCELKDSEKHVLFSQPVIQTAQMFLGETGCWLVVGGFYIYKRYFSKDAPLLHGGYQQIDGHDHTIESEDDDPQLNRSFSAQESAGPATKALVPNADDRRPLVGWRIILLALPACCDIAGTTLMNVGLLFVAASIYQMTRGALVLFVGLFSVIFLRRKLYLYQWCSLFIVVLGVAIVGLAGAIAPNPQAKPEPRSFVETSVLVLRAATDQVKIMGQKEEALQTVAGVLMIAGAQIFTATQFVLEEFILEKYALEPLKVVGWEGIFGFLVTVIGMIILHLAVGRTEQGRYGYFDVIEGWREVTHYKAVAISSILIMISIGGFNFFGLSVTRTVSATARSTIDTCRTLFIWIVSLGLGWETFKWLQILGFALLVYGTFLFNDIVQPPLRACIRKQKRGELLPEEPIEHM